jgi:hypothetical protein
VKWDDLAKHITEILSGKRMEGSMTTFRNPDWKKPICTGIWGLGFHVRDCCDVVLVSNGTSNVGEDQERLWPFLLMQNGQRNVGTEQSLKTRPQLQGILERQSLNNEEILCVREKHLGELLSALGCSE